MPERYCICGAMVSSDAPCGNCGYTNMLRDFDGTTTREACPWCGELWECQPTCRDRFEDGVDADEC